jgi:hypothetical protein
MSDFRSEISRRIARTRAQLADAQARGDDHLVEVTLGELETLARIALDHGVPAEGVEESLAPYGLTTPAAGLPRPA